MSEIESYWINNAKENSHNLIKYINWFDKAESVKEYLALGHIDFFNRILTIDMYKHLGNPYNKKSLEIGFGGGRLIGAATNVFKHCYGIDIINEECMNKTEEIIRNTNNENFTLLHRENKSKISENSIDFIYSFIVFQHFSGVNEIIDYIEFANRVLKKKGCGIFYFGRNDKDCKDFIELKELKNQRGCALFLSKKFAKELIEKYFKVIEVGEVTKKPWLNKRSGQFYIKFTR